LRITDAASTASKWGVIGKWIYCPVKVVTAVCKLDLSKTPEADGMSGVAILERRGRKMARGVVVETASVSIWGPVTGGGSARRRACRIGTLCLCGRGQRDARRRNSGNQYEFGLVDHRLSPEFCTRQRRDAMLFGDQEVGSMGRSSIKYFFITLFTEVH
jgi:hypothetical protein